VTSDNYLSQVVGTGSGVRSQDFSVTWSLNFLTTPNVGIWYTKFQDLTTSATSTIFLEATSITLSGFTIKVDVADGT
jgi:hypothetical protein